MVMTFRFCMPLRVMLSGAGFCALLVLAEGGVTNTLDTVSERNIAEATEPSNPAQLKPVDRVPRDQFGQVPEGQFVDAHGNLTNLAARSLFFPSLNEAERKAIAEGTAFFTTPHTVEEGLGPVNNQVNCLGCHLNSSETPPEGELVTNDTQVSRAARATPSNFNFIAEGLDSDFNTGGRAADNIDAIDDTGRTAAFTLFGDFSPSTGIFETVEGFGDAVQHTRPSLPECLPDAIPPVSVDPFLNGGIDSDTGTSPQGFRRAVGERAGPPYIGRGLMEAIPADDLIAHADPQDAEDHRSSLNVDSDFPKCAGDCISGRPNEAGDEDTVLGRFGLRAAGPVLMDFILGGAATELGFTNPFRLDEPPFSIINVDRDGCEDPVPDPDIGEDVIFSLVDFIRMTAPPELGNELLTVLENPTDIFDPTTKRGMVQRGAQLFGIDLVAFANRIIGPMPAGGDRRDNNAINVKDRQLNCVGCHTPVHATGESPSDVGARHLSYKWVHLFSDLLIHDMGEVTPERRAPTPRDPLQGQSLANPRATDSFDISRNLADDALPSQGLANGSEWRTPPLWGMGKTSPPFLHDARVYLSQLSVDTTPASTVYTDSTVTNAPLVVQTQDDAIKAAIELHDLPAPDDGNTPADGGCPVPAGNLAGAGGAPIEYTNGADDICPPYESPTSSNRSEAKEVIRRYRRLSPEDQQALIEFLKQL
jgi:CxxC motif-containing protein (DUF1111 family)